MRTSGKAQQRLSQVASHFSPRGAKGVSVILEKHPDDIVVTCALRTAITKGGKGGFKDTAPSDLLAGILQAIINQSGIDPSLVGDIAVGSVLALGGGATEFRAAALVAGFPETTAVRSLNRQCSSGLQALVDIINSIKAGVIDVGIGAGVENMSLQYGYVIYLLPHTHTALTRPFVLISVSELLLDTGREQSLNSLTCLKITWKRPTAKCPWASCPSRWLKIVTSPAPTKTPLLPLHIKKRLKRRSRVFSMKRLFPFR
jgi:Thiolase, N-terminal domain